MRRLLRIEQAKAKERMEAGTLASNDAGVGRSDEATAKAFDMSATTMRRELFIADNETPTDARRDAERSVFGPKTSMVGKWSRWGNAVRHSALHRLSS